MKHLLSALLLSASLVGAVHTPAAAQSDILLRLRSGSPPGDRMRVDSAGGLVAMGNLGIGIIPATGCGDRMMWYPYKSAFRAGGTDDNGACSYWDDANIGFYSWAGGNLSAARAFATFAFGDQVDVSGVTATGFGSNNTVSGESGFSAGENNTCAGFACIAVGFTANASGQGAIALGYRTTADANYSVAIGQRGSTNGYTGAIVLSDASTSDSLQAGANNSFSSRYAGGYRLFTNATMTAGMSMNAGGSSWLVLSDRNRKEAFLGVDGEDVLARIRSLPVTTWRYRDEEDRTVRHIGPMAQDWQRAFGFSADGTTINMSDFDGVNLAAIQALEQRTAGHAEELRAVRAENAALREANERLREQNAGLEARMQRLEALAEGRTAP